MSDFVFNNVKGKVKYYTELPGTNDALVVIPLEATGLEADATLKDYDTLAALLAGSSNEQTTWGRKTAASVTNTVDDTNDRFDADFVDPTWAAGTTTGNDAGALIVCYDPDATTGTDADLIPLTKHDFAVASDGSQITATVAASGFYRAS